MNDAGPPNAEFEALSDSLFTSVRGYCSAQIHNAKSDVLERLQRGLERLMNDFAAQINDNVLEKIEAVHEENRLLKERVALLEGERRDIE